MRCAAFRRCPQYDLASELIRWVQINAGGVPLSYLLQEATVRLLGFSPFAARLPAALASIAGAIAFIAILRRLKIGAPTMALVLFLLVPLQFRYAVEGLGYSLGLCFCLISFWTFLRLVETPSLAWAAAYALSIALGLYSQPLMIFPALAQVVWSWKYKQRHGRFALAAVAVTTAVLAFLPWYIGQQGLQQQTGTMKIVFFSWQQVRPLILLHDVTGGGYAVAIPLILLAGYGLYTQRGSAEHVLLALALIAAWVGPILMDGVVNYFFAPRQLLFAIPFLVLLAASGAYALWLRSRVSGVLAAVAVGASLFADYGQAVYSKDDLMIAAQTARELVGPDGCLAVVPTNWVAYFTFFEPNLPSGSREGSGASKRLVAVRAAPATAMERSALSAAVPEGFVKKKKRSPATVRSLPYMSLLRMNPSLARPIADQY